MDVREFGFVIDEEITSYKRPEKSTVSWGPKSVRWNLCADQKAQWAVQKTQTFIDIT